MPASKKPRKPYRRRLSIYPDLRDIHLVFRPITVLFEHLRTGEVHSARGVPIFKDWMGKWCEVVPALEGWADCWQRIAEGEGLLLSLVAIRKLAKRLNFDVPVTEEELETAWLEVRTCMSAAMKIPRRRIGSYMRTEMIAIELDRLGMRDAA